MYNPPAGYGGPPGYGVPPGGYGGPPGGPGGPPGGPGGYGGPPPGPPGYGGPPGYVVPPGGYGGPPSGYGGPPSGYGGPQQGPYMGGGPGYVGPGFVDPYQVPVPQYYPPQQQQSPYHQWVGGKISLHPHGHETGHEEEPEFKYFKGGEDWGDRFHLELGCRQSPVDIKYNSLVSDPGIDFKLHFFNKGINCRTQYTSSTFKVLPTQQPFGEITLSKEYKSQIYDCNTLHFHAKSEHRINAKQYDAEMHMVFKTVGQKSFHEEICVIGILFRINPIKASEEKRAVIKSLHPKKEGEHLINFHDLLTKLLFFNPKFLHYRGSLTTPPCTETVNWFVYHQPIHVLEEDLEPFLSRWIFDKSFSDGNGNCRHCFPCKDRNVCLVKAHP